MSKSKLNDLWTISISDLCLVPEHLLSTASPNTTALVAKTDILESLFEYANKPWYSSKEALDKMCDELHITLDKTATESCLEIVRKYKTTRSGLEKAVDTLYDIFNPSDVPVWNNSIDF